MQEGIIFVTMDKQDLVSGCKYPFRFENNEDEDDDDDEDNNEYEESDDDADLDTHEFPLLEPCDHSTARTESRGSFFQTLNAQAQARPDETPLEPSARFKIRRDDRGNKTKATLTFEPALYA